MGVWAEWQAANSYGTGGGYVKRREIMGDMLDCDVSRVYDGSVRRTMAEDS